MALIGGTGGIAGFFGAQTNIFGQPTAPQGPQIQGISANLLSASINADLFALSLQASRLSGPNPNIQTGPQLAQTPFNQPEDERSLTQRVDGILRADSVIDLADPIVRDASDEPAAQATFVIFNALSDLQTLAEAAGEESTTQSRRDELDARFQAGLEEVRAYVNGLDIAPLFIQSGDRSSGVRTGAEIGNTAFTVQGAVLQTGLRGDVIPGLTGTEQFQIQITERENVSGTVQDVTTSVSIDLSNITDTLNLDALRDLINQELSAIQATDSNGDPLFDGNGDPVERFVTNVEVFEDSEGNFGLEVRGSPFEQVRIIPTSATPSLFVGGTSAPLTGGTTTGLITQVTDATGTLSEGDNFTIAGDDPFGTQADAAIGDEPREDPFGFLEGFVFPSERDAQDEEAAARTTIQDIAVDSQGFIYAVGATAGQFDQNANVSAGGDLFLTKFDSQGNEVFSRFLGTSAAAEGFQLAFDGDENVIVVGQSTEEGLISDVFSGQDSVVSKFDRNGGLIFTQQFDSFGEDGITDVVVAPTGEIFVGGTATSNVGGTAVGGQDGLLFQLNAETGAIEQQTQFGTTGTDGIAGLAIANDGSLLVLSEQNGDAVLERRDTANITSITDSQNLGSLAAGSLSALTVTGTTILIGGTVDGGSFTGGATVVNTADGNDDGFVLQLTDTGTTFTPDRIAFLGSANTDSVNDIIVEGADIFVAGTAGGDLEGETRVGPRDAFAARLDLSTLAVEDVLQLGQTVTNRTGVALAYAPIGPSDIDILGFPTSTLITDQDDRIISRTAVRAGDQFTIATGSRTFNITIREDDTFDTLARRIDLLDFRNFEASVLGGELRIGALEGRRIEVLAGPEGRDALSRLGIKPVTLFGTDLLFNLDDGDDDFTNDIGGAFALNINQDFRLNDSNAAQFTFNQLENALSTTSRAFRSLTPNPAAGVLDRLPQGAPPPGAAARLANLSQGLARLQSFAGPTSLIV